jgi:hypothetical protein
MTLNRMRRGGAAVLACVFLFGAAEPAAKERSAFDILGASVTVNVERAGTTLPASAVPSLRAGDAIELSFPKGVQFSRSPRWHLVVANMYSDYLQHPPTFAIADADLSRAKPGNVWSVRVQPDATPLVFLVPEDGSRYGHGLPDARAAITNLANRALLLKSAELSASAQAKASTMHAFLVSMADIQPSQLPDGRARVSAATQSLFGSDLGDSACFDATAAQSTQYACVANAVAAGYDKTPSSGIGAVLGDELPIGAATYGMLIGTLYALLAKRRVAAHYTFVPGVIKPGATTTDVYVAQHLQYDATATKPSTIVYFTVGSHATSPKTPSYVAAPELPVCFTGRSIELDVLFSGLPIYFRSHTVTLKGAADSFTVAATYDPVLGYRAELTAPQFTQLASGGTATVSSTWGFDTFRSGPVRTIEPHAVVWSLRTGGGDRVVSGDKASTLTFEDAGAGQGSCVQSVAVLDGLGHTVPVTSLERTKDTVTVTLDASTALGPNGSAILKEGSDIATAPIPYALFPALPSITSAIAYLPKGVLVLRGTGLKYINTVTLERTGITFGAGTPNADGSWIFTAAHGATYKPAWEHETMAIAFTLQPPDTRTDAVEADVVFAPTPSPSPSPAPASVLRL